MSWLKDVLTKTIKLAGAEQVSRRTLNFVAGDGVTISADDDDVGKATVITISAEGGGGGEGDPPTADAQSFLGNPTGVEAEVTSIAAAVNTYFGRGPSGNIAALTPNTQVFTNSDSGGGNPSTKVGPHEARAFASLSTAANRNEDFTLADNGYYTFRVTLVVRLASAGEYRKITQTVDGVRASGTLTILGTAQQVATGVPTGLTMTLSATSGNLRANVANAAGASVVGYIEFGYEIRDGIST